MCGTYTILVAWDVLNKATTDLTVVNTVTETNLYSFTIPANRLASSDLIFFVMVADAVGNVAVDADNGSRIRIKLGGTEIYNDDYFSPTASTSRRAVFMSFMLALQNATNDEILGGWGVRYSTVTSPAVGRGDLGTYTSIDSPVVSADAAIDMTLAQTFAVSVQHNVASASLELRRRCAILWASDAEAVAGQPYAKRSGGIPHMREGKKIGHAIW